MNITLTRLASPVIVVRAAVFDGEAGNINVNQNRALIPRKMAAGNERAFAASEGIAAGP